jgi:hypothetical protein
LLCLCALPASGTTFVLFDNDGSFSTPSFTEANVTVTGSADVNLFQSNGLGIVGGASDLLVDGFEYVDFTFTTPVINATYRLDTFACTANGGSCIGGLRWIEAFTPGGVSLGSIQTSGFDSAVSSLFGNVPIGRFRLTHDATIQDAATGAVSDGLRIQWITYDITAVPLPAGVWLFGSGLLGLIGTSRRRKAA